MKFKNQNFEALILDFTICVRKLEEAGRHGS
jgi:hypothetical protein